MTAAGLEATIAEQAETIRSQAETIAHFRKIFDRASEAARIGVWECDLPEGRLRWTDVVYDIFELRRGSRLDRESILSFYPPELLEALNAARERAIAECSGFVLDLRILTGQGRERWLRINAVVECEGGAPLRIFGMKQDITEERLLLERTRYLAEYDAMTGVANRSLFQSRLSAFDAAGDAGETTGGALILVDLDGFKQVNDTFGHPAGDACLKEAADRLRGTCAEADLVARIGGDEFAVLVRQDTDGPAVGRLAAAIVEAMDRPFRVGGLPVRLGASVGAACHDGGGGEELFMRADAALYAAKAAGRSTHRMFAPAMLPRGANRAA